MRKFLGGALITVKRANNRKVSWTEHTTQGALDRAVGGHKRHSREYRFAYRVNVYAKEVDTP